MYMGVPWSLSVIFGKIINLGGTFCTSKLSLKENFLLRGVSSTTSCLNFTSKTFKIY